MIQTFTKVIMDSGKEYVIKEHPGDLLKRIYDEDTAKINTGFIHEDGFSISIGHISSIESIVTQDKNIGFLK